ncbi:hypothetical protein FOZ62_027935, partial [Perkinsus olseni]
MERLSGRTFPLVFFHCDNRTTQLAFQSGRSTSASAKDGTHVLGKYVALAYALYDQADFNKRLRVVRIDTKSNPADALTRHVLLSRIRKLEERFSVDCVDDNRDDANCEIDNGLFFEDWLDEESDDSATEDEECRKLKTIAATISLAATDSPPTTPSTDAMRPMPRSPPSDPILRGLFEHQQADDELNAVYEAVAAGQPPTSP